MMYESRSSLWLSSLLPSHPPPPVSSVCCLSAVQTVKPNRKSRAVQSVNISTVNEISYKSLSVITLLSITQMAVLLFPCGVMKGTLVMLSRPQREYFDGTNTAWARAQGPSTLYVTVNRVTMETTKGRTGIERVHRRRGRQRSGDTATLRGKEAGRERRSREEFMPIGWKGIDDTIHQLSRFDLRALPSRLSHRGIETLAVKAQEEVEKKKKL